MHHGSQGVLEFRSVAGKTVLTRSRAASPLTLLSPRRRGSPCAWAVSGTLGGGLVAGDRICLEVTVHDNCSAVLGTQALTKVYRSPDELACRQELTARVEKEALLVVAPDPVSCFADAVYEQRQRFDLHDSAALVVVDWITSGRAARGERWQMKSCRLRTDIFVEDRQVFRDALRLDAADGPLDSQSRMGRFDCWASVIILGRRLAAPVDELLGWIASRPVAPGAPLLFSAGLIPGGMMLRAVAASVEQMSRWLRERLAFLAEWTGEDPWSRKG